MRRSGMVVLAAGLVLAGCTEQGIGRDEPVSQDRGVEDRTPYEQLDNVAQSDAESYGGPAPAPVTPVQGGSTVGGPLTATGQFVGVGQNEAPGSVTLTQEGNGTRLSVLVRRYTANAQLQLAIVRGGCENAGGVVHAVREPIATGNDGVADLSVVVPVPTAQLLDGQHSVRLGTAQSAGGGAAGLVGCARLPAQR